MEIQTLSKELKEKRKEFGFFHVLVVWFNRKFLKRQKMSKQSQIKPLEKWCCKEEKNEK